MTREISTHALREEGDPVLQHLGLPNGISTHALREEGDISCGTRSPRSAAFLPTPSARRATSAHHSP